MAETLVTLLVFLALGFLLVVMGVLFFSAPRKQSRARPRAGCIFHPGADGLYSVKAITWKPGPGKKPVPAVKVVLPHVGLGGFTRSLFVDLPGARQWYLDPDAYREIDGQLMATWVCPVKDPHTAARYLQLGEYFRQHYVRLFVQDRWTSKEVRDWFWLTSKAEDHSWC